MVNKPETREKLMSFPKIILDELDKYKEMTGISSSAYIRIAVVKQMIWDKLIYFKTIDINDKTYKKIGK